MLETFKIINERISYFRLKAKWFSCTLINAHAPTNQKTEEVKEELYNLLQQNINQTVNSDIKIILGDFNAKVGKEDIYTNLPLAMNVYIMKPTTTESK
jgi:exonuclease III